MAPGRNYANATATTTSAEGPSRGHQRRCQSHGIDTEQGQFREERCPGASDALSRRRSGRFSGRRGRHSEVAFVGRIPSVDVNIDGSDFVIDFLQMLEFDLNACRRKSIVWIDFAGNCFFPKVLIGEESGSGPSSPRKREVDNVAKGSNAAGPSEVRFEAQDNADGNGSDDDRINAGKRTVGSADRLNPGEGFEIAICLPDSDGNGGAAVGGGSRNVEPANGNEVTAPGNANGGPIGLTAPGEAEYTSLWKWGVERLTSVKRRARMGSTAPRAADPSPVNRQVGREVTAPRKARGKSVNRRASKGKKVAAVPDA